MNYSFAFFPECIFTGSIACSVFDSYVLTDDQWTIATLTLGTSITMTLIMVGFLVDAIRM